MSETSKEWLVEMAVSRAMRAGADSDKLRASAEAIVKDARIMADRDLLVAIYVMLRCR